MELQNDPPMDQTWYQRTQILYGAERMQRLAAAHVLVVGLGGVGAYAAEMLCRAGVGCLTLVDADAVSLTNINRQLPALHSTIGQSKVQLLRQRFLDINPETKGHTLVVPKVEVDKIYELSDEDYKALMDTVKKLSIHMEQVLGQRTLWKVIGTDVPHAHVHLLPFDETWVHGKHLELTPEEFEEIRAKLAFTE